MIHDYWMFQDDPGFVRTMLPGARATVGWFLDHLQDDVRFQHLPGPLPWWNFVDWAEDFPNGRPPSVDEGGSAIIALQMILALRELAELEVGIGRAFGVDAHGMSFSVRIVPTEMTWAAGNYRDRANDIARAVRRHCWDDTRGLLADTPEKAHFSQHANILGILTDVITTEESRAVAEKLLSEPADRLTQATFYFRFYLHRALRKAGLGDRYLEWLDPWRRMLALGLSTWAEKPEPTRSDCHAWSAHPNIDLLATVLGVEPAEPGFAKVVVAPHLGPLEWAEGAVPHPRGEVSVKLRREGKTLHAEIALPEGISGVFRHDGREQELRPGPQTLTL